MLRNTCSSMSGKSKVATLTQVVYDEFGKNAQSHKGLKEVNLFLAPAWKGLAVANGAGLTA